MNIFFIDDIVNNPLLTANSLADQHYSRMIYETCVILGNAYYQDSKQTTIDGLYRPHYWNHPQCRWVRESVINFIVITTYLKCLISEYDRKGGAKESWVRERNMLTIFESSLPNLPDVGLTLPYLTFGNKDNPKLDRMYKQIQSHYGTWNSETKTWGVDSWDTTIMAYRHYYNLKVFKNDKLPTWKKDPASKPKWYDHATEVSSLSSTKSECASNFELKQTCSTYS